MKLFVTDLDGTLLNSQKEISDENQRAIRKLAAKNVTFAFATGRGAANALAVMDTIGISRAYLICLNGSAIVNYPEAKLLYQKSMPEAVLKECLTIGSNYQVPLVFPTLDDSRHILFEEGQQKLRYGRNEQEELDLEAMGRYIHKKEIAKVVFTSTLEQELEAVKEELVQRGYQPMFTDRGFLELLPSGCNKGTSVLWLADKLAVDPAEIVAVGDQENDLEMLRVAGCGAAVANAVAAVKKIANVVTDSNDANGVAELIYTHLDKMND